MCALWTAASASASDCATHAPARSSAEDVAAVAKPVMNHRLILNYQARFDRVDTDKVLDDLIEELDDAGLDLPADVTLQNA